MAETPIVKPGYKTTEFWVATIGSILPLIWGVLPPWVTAALGGTYILSRAVVKSMGPFVEKPDAP